MAAESRTTVVLPCGDTVEFLVQAVQSCLDQTSPPSAIVIVDDATRAGAHEAIGEVGAVDSRIRVVANRGIGLVAALNTGLGLVRTRYVARMDADDVNLPHRFHDQEEALADLPGVVAVGGLVRYMSQEGKPLPEIPWVRRGFPVTAADVSRAMAESNSVFHPTAMMRTQAVMAVGGYREAYAHIEDYDLWLRLLSLGDIINLPDHVLLYRRHADQVSERHGPAQARLVTRLHADLDQAHANARHFGALPQPRNYAIRGCIEPRQAAGLLRQMARISAFPAHVLVQPDRVWSPSEERSVHLAASLRGMLGVTISERQHDNGSAHAEAWADSLPAGCTIAEASLRSSAEFESDVLAADLITAPPKTRSALASIPRGGWWRRMVGRLRTGASKHAVVDLAVHGSPRAWLAGSEVKP